MPETRYLSCRVTLAQHHLPHSYWRKQIQATFCPSDFPFLFLLGTNKNNFFRQWPKSSHWTIIAYAQLLALKEGSLNIATPGKSPTFSFCNEASKGSPLEMRFFQTWSICFSAAFLLFFSTAESQTFVGKYNLLVYWWHSQFSLSPPAQTSCVYIWWEACLVLALFFDCHQQSWGDYFLELLLPPQWTA